MLKFIKKMLRSLKNKKVYSETGERVSLGKHYNLDAHLEQVLSVYSIDTVIDVGANTGQFGTKIRKMGFKGNIYSFEPVKHIYDELTKSSANDKSWTTFNVGLGSQQSTAEINISASSDFSSILVHNDFGAARFKGIKVEEKQNIEIYRLDKFIKDIADLDGKRVMLKMDTQGYDFEVFAGALGILSNICAVTSELSLIPIYHNMRHYTEMLDMYEKNDFRVSGIYPVSRNKDDLSLIEVDCVLVQRKLYRS